MGLRSFGMAMSCLLIAAGCGKKGDAAAPGGAQLVSHSAASLTFEAIPDAKGAEIAVVHQDPETKSVSAFVRFPPGWNSGPHFHTGKFLTVVVDGEMEVVAGDKVTKRPLHHFQRGTPNAVHTGRTKGGATIFLASNGPFGTVFVDAEGKPLKAGDPAPGPVPTLEHKSAAVADLEWKAPPGGKGIKVANVYTDDKTGASAFYVKLDAGWSHGRHFHTANFDRLVLEGAMTVTPAGGSPVPGGKGDYLRGVKDLVHTGTTKDGALLFLVTDGKFETIDVDENGKPLKPSE